VRIKQGSAERPRHASRSPEASKNQGFRRYERSAETTIVQPATNDNELREQDAWSSRAPSSTLIRQKIQAHQAEVMTFVDRASGV